MKKPTTNSIKFDDITIRAIRDTHPTNLDSSFNGNETVILEISHPILTNVLVTVRPKQTSLSDSPTNGTGLNSNGEIQEKIETIDPQTLQRIRHIRPADLESSEIQKLLNQLLTEYFTHTRENSYRPSKRNFCDSFCQRKKNIIIRYTSMRLNPTFQDLWQNSILLENKAYDEY